MSNKCTTKIIYKKLPTTILFKDDIFKFLTFDQLKEKILEKSKLPIFNQVKISKNDKFKLEICDFEVPGLKEIWNSETYNYFYEKITKNPPKKLKLAISKIDKEPKWEKPKYFEILKKSLDSTWNITKEEIKNDLTEKYLNEGKRKFIQDKKENERNFREELLNEMHINIICNNCFTSNFCGARYICCECNNFNLCEYCQKNARIAHQKEHTFIKINNPVEVDIQKFNNIFPKNKQLLRRNLEPFEIEIDIMNNGQSSLKGCFISPIRFGKKYLGCLKRSITEQCDKGDKITLPIFIKFDDEEFENNTQNIYEGYFRLMTIEGIPFGDILYIKLIIEE